jgi:hypothetical protein
VTNKRVSPRFLPSESLSLPAAEAVRVDPPGEDAVSLNDEIFAAFRHGIFGRLRRN